MSPYCKTFSTLQDMGSQIVKGRFSNTRKHLIFLLMYQISQSCRWKLLSKKLYYEISGCPLLSNKLKSFILNLPFAADSLVLFGIIKLIVPYMTWSISSFIKNLDQDFIILLKTKYFDDRKNVRTSFQIQSQHQKFRHNQM